MVSSIDRLSRNKMDLKKELLFFKENNIRLNVLDMPTTMVECHPGSEWIMDMINEMMIEVIASFAEHEREVIKQRQAEGIAVAKAKGKHLGRPKAVKPENFDTVTARWRAGEITAVEAMRLTGLKRGTFYKLVREGDDNT